MDYLLVLTDDLAASMSNLVEHSEVDFCKDGMVWWWEKYMACMKLDEKDELTCADEMGGGICADKMYWHVKTWYEYFLKRRMKHSQVLVLVLAVALNSDK